MNRHRIYGLVVDSNRPFRAPLPDAAGADPVDLHLEWVETLDAVEADVRSGIPDATPDAALVVKRAPGRWRVDITGTGAYDLYPDRIVIAPAGDGTRAEIQLLGVVLALWLELAGVTVLHAAAIMWERTAIGLLGWNGSGKTSLAIDLMRQGARLLADDLAAVRAGTGGWTVAPGYPQLRLWPHQATTLLGDTTHLDLAHPDFEKLRVPVGSGGVGEFEPQPGRLRSLWVLEPEPGAALRVEDLSPAAATIELTRHSFVAPLLPGLRLHPERLPRMARLAVAVPVRKVAYDIGRVSLVDVVREVRSGQRTGAR